MDLQIDHNQAYVLNRSVAVHDSDALLVRFPQLHPSHLPADQMVNPPIIGQLEHNGRTGAANLPPHVGGDRWVDSARTILAHCGSV
jgi:hypothetical protein